MAVALTGCVIIKQEERGPDAHVIYKKKCEHCGWVDNCGTSTMVPDRSTSGINTSFKCPKCKARNDLKIQGSR